MKILNSNKDYIYNNYCLLEWDSQFFGYKIASIRAFKLKLNELIKIIKRLRKQGFRLAYCFTGTDDEISNNSLKNASGLLVDEKITFFKRINEENNFTFSTDIKPYRLHYATEKLKSLALQSGIYSRFKIDPNFHNNEYEKLYLEWIEKSVKKDISNEILVYNENDDEKGFVTMVIKNNTGSIGLIAVDEKERGKSIGKKLMNAALFSFNVKKVNYIEVVTQKTNKGACEFYKSLDFEIKSIVNIYHLWIK